ncbi:MAG: ATP-dependent RecD-like DNA helicase [Candidatus Muirbacterium halophilum]|nr:ATP-dependent RecD-like DNA helicase [Candidatus Muirbacterium halophilum]MCK9477643.1 ATP-dependent RecD-like DNA helicase [Candidatus Muirbacterium halophilum]
METIKSKIRWVIFKKENFYILDLNDGIKAKGNIYDNMNGDIRGLEYSFSGEWTQDKYGKIFKFEQAKMEDNNIFFFLTSIVKGIGENYATLLLEKFGDDIEEIIEKTPWKLSEVPGVGQKRIQKIVKSWNEHSQMKKLADYLSNTGVNAGIISKIFDTFRENSVNTVKENPYIITTIQGITFPIADRIALRTGFDFLSEKRIFSAVEHVFRTISYDKGDTWLNKDEIIKYSTNLLGFSFDEIDSINLVLKNNTDLISVDEKITLKGIYSWEKTIFRFFKENYKLSIFSTSEVENYIIEFEKDNNIKLSFEQKKAIYCSTDNKISALTGYAGTGKTTVARAILNVLSFKFHSSIAGCAMSGIAARRLQTLTGFPCFTIHSLLGFDGNDFSYNRFNPLEYDVIILDEAAMVNSELLYNLITALMPDTIFIMIGDDAQLPPIGPANVFSDVIQKKLIPYIKLEKIFRQHEDSVINIFATEIRHTRIPNNFDSTHLDWFFKNISISEDCLMQMPKSEARRYNNEKILCYFKKICKDYYKKGIENRFTGIQILSPQKKGILGTENLNYELSNIFNPRHIISDKNKIIKNNKTFACGDKVVHLKNSDKKVWEDIWDWKNSRSDTSCVKRIFNGTIGIIEKIESGNIYVQSIMDEIIEYSPIELDDILDLAYALTIHKSQGSEFEIVIIPVTSSHKIMLDNQLMYTAITRAKKGLILCGEKDAFVYSCMNDSKKFRNTWLSLF